MRIRWFWLLVATLVMSSPLRGGNYEHTLIAKSGDLAPGTNPPQRFSAFDPSSHFITDDNQVIFRAQLEDKKWGYWHSEDSDIGLLFYEDAAPPQGLINPTFYHQIGHPILMHTPSVIAGGDDQFFELVDPTGISGLLPQPINTAKFEFTRWQFSGHGIIGLQDAFTDPRISYTTPKTPLGENLETVGCKFFYQGRTYETTSMNFPAGADGAFAAYWVKAITKNAEGQFVDDIEAIRLRKHFFPGKETIFATDSISLATLSVGNRGDVAFKARANQGPWTIYAKSAIGDLRVVAEEGGATPAGDPSIQFETIRFFQVSTRGAVTFMAKTTNDKWGIWTEVTENEKNYELVPVVIEGMTSPHDPNLKIDSLLRGIANDDGLIAFVSTQDDQSGRHAGTTYWTAHIDTETKEPVHRPIVSTFEPVFELPEGQLVSGREISGLGITLRTQSPHGVVRPFNRLGKLTLRVRYLDQEVDANGEVAFSERDSIWLSERPSLIVNSLGDEPDPHPGDGAADIRADRTNGAPIGTLRAAIQEANALGYGTQIEFRFDPKDITDNTVTLAPKSPLPEIRASIDINLDLQENAFGIPLKIILSGANQTVPADGLVFNKHACQLFDVTVSGFGKAGIRSKKGAIRLVNVDVESNGEHGIHAHSLFIDVKAPRDSVSIKKNGKSGIFVTGSLDANACEISENSEEGIVSTGERLLLNRFNDSSFDILNNGKAGLRANSAKSLFADQLIITDNGQKKADSGFGLVAPFANVVLFDAIISHNKNTGLVFDSGELLNDCQIERNGGHGVRVYGPLTTERVAISGNKEWGIFSDGAVLKINEDSEDRSLIELNELGGITHTGTSLYLEDTEVRLNGDTTGFFGGKGEGVKAPMAHATLVKSSIIDNAESGLIANQLTLTGSPSEFKTNGAHGALIKTGVMIEDGCTFSENKAWGLVAEGGMVSIGFPGGTRENTFASNEQGGLRYQGLRLEAWDIDILKNGLPANLGDGLDAERAEVILRRASIADNAGTGLKASTADIEKSNIGRQGLDGVSVCSGPVVMDSTSLVDNGASGLVVCDGLIGGPSVLKLVLVEGNFSDGVRNESSFPMDITESVFNLNGRFAVTNSAPVLGNVVAIGNSWGHPTGPSGAGPGQGDAISRNVIYEELIPLDPLELIVPESPYRIPAGIPSSLNISLNQGFLDQTVTLQANDSQSWLTPESASPITLEMNGGQTRAEIVVNPPATAAPGQTSELLLKATPEDPSGTTEATVILEIAPAALTRVEIQPQGIELTTGQMVQFEASGFDQLDRPIAITPEWSLIGGSGELTPTGQFTAPLQPGTATIQVRAESDLLASTQITVIQDPNAPALPDPGNSITQFRNRTGDIIKFSVTGRSGLSVWGTNIYTDDSDVGIAAVHAGLLEVGETADLQVLITPGQSAYRGTERNGIASRPFGRYAGSYQIFAQDLDLSSEAELFNNTNEQTPGNAPAEPTTVNLDRRVFLGNITTLQEPSTEDTRIQTISLVSTDGHRYGPWQLVRQSSAAAETESRWVTTPRIILDPDTYTLEHSSPEVWHANTDSNQQGFAILSGIALGDPVAPSPTEPTPEPDPEPVPSPSAPEITPLPSGIVAGFRGQNDLELYVEITGTVSGSIWGTGIYTDDSPVAAAAVHAGVLADGETGTVKVTILPGQPSYEGSLQNGIQSSAYPAWSGSFSVEPAILHVEKPELAIEFVNGIISVTWVSESDAFLLKSTSDLSGMSNWDPVSGVQQDGNNYRYTVPEVSGTAFFRLETE